MPLLDHFHPPLSERRHWEAFHSRWASAIADALNEQALPEHFFAEPTVTLGNQFQVDVATLDASTTGSSNGVQATAVLPKVMTAPPTWVLPAIFPDAFGVRIISSDGGPRLVAAIELVSPGNKDRPQSRRAFAIKCANYLHQAIPCIVMDVVTNRSANLHNEMMDLLERTSFRLPTESPLYATAYRPVTRAGRGEIDVWPTTFQVGDRLPTLPLYLDSEAAVLVDFEATYQETRTRLRLQS